jgi:hypothetical protein
MIILVPVHTAVWSSRGLGAPLIGTADQALVAGL